MYILTNIISIQQWYICDVALFIHLLYVLNNNKICVHIDIFTYIICTLYTIYSQSYKILQRRYYENIVYLNRYNFNLRRTTEQKYSEPFHYKTLVFLLNKIY